MSKGGRFIHKRFWQIVVGAVEEVECLRLNLQREGIAPDTELARNGGVCRDIPGTPHNISSGIAKGVSGRDGEGCGVEPTICCARCQFGIPQNIRTVVAISAAGVAGIAVVEPQNRGEWLARIGAEDGARLQAKRHAPHRGDAGPLADVEARQRAFRCEIAAVLRKVLVGFGGQKGG